MHGSALALAETRLAALQSQVATLEAAGGGGQEDLLKSLRVLRQSVAASTERSLAVDAKRAALRAEVKAAAAANDTLRYQNEMAALSPDGMAPIPIDVIDLKDITRERFREEYQVPNRPVVLTNALAEWPASSKWSIDWFTDNYGDAEVEVSLDGAQAGSKNICKLREYIATLDTLEADAAAHENDSSHYTPYLRAWQYEENHPELSKDFLVQYVSPATLRVHLDSELTEHFCLTHPSMRVII